MIYRIDHAAEKESLSDNRSQFPEPPKPVTNSCSDWSIRGFPSFIIDPFLYGAAASVWFLEPQTGQLGFRLYSSHSVIYSDQVIISLETSISLIQR